MSDHASWNDVFHLNTRAQNSQGEYKNCMGHRSCLVFPVTASYVGNDLNSFVIVQQTVGSWHS